MKEPPTNHRAGPGGLSAALRGREHPRFWWHRPDVRGYEPDIYRVLAPQERDLLLEWYDDTLARRMVGEMAVPMASALLGLVNGSGMRRIVQLGHYAGYSTLLLGWTLRRMGAERGLFSIDLKPQCTEYTQAWLDRAELGAYVRLHTADSASSACPVLAREYLGGPPVCVVIDSSHQYAHTLAELDLWYEALAPGGILLLHDASPGAAKYDRSGQGGVRGALDEWLARPGAPRALTLLGPPSHGDEAPYADPSGLCLIQRPPRMTD